MFRIFNVNQVTSIAGKNFFFVIMGTTKWMKERAKVKELKEGISLLNLARCS